MPKTTYTATFSNGQSFTRKSHRPYTFAWSFPVDRPNYKGFCKPSFSSTRELAAAALANATSKPWSDHVGPGEVVEVVAS